MLYSPGNLTVIRIRASEHVTAGFTDYSITLKPCEDITIVFGHVSSLLADLFGDSSSYQDWRLNSEYSTGSETYRVWTQEIDIKVTAGEVLGTTGGNPGIWAWDFGVYDQRRSQKGVANPQRWETSRALTAVCLLPYFEEGPVLDQLVGLVHRDKVEGETLPCGSNFQDLPGTAQGNWFLPGVNDTYPEDPHLALVHSNIHPDHAVLSVGNSSPNLRYGKYEFLPASQGLLNRDFRDIIPDGQIYGFQTSVTSVPYGLGFSGVIIIMMPDAETLWIDALRGAATEPASWVFTENKTVFVR